MMRVLGVRLARTLVTVLVVLTFAFILARLAGDPVELLLPNNPTPESVNSLRTALGLNEPLWQQYVSFLGSATHGDFGNSIVQGQPALGIVVERLPATLTLAVISFTIGLIAAILIAVLGEIFPSARFRAAVLWAATVRQAIPPYVFGILLVLIFAVWLQWLPSIGNSKPANYVLPVITICSFEIALYVRLLNSAFAESRAQDFVRTARAKGVSRTRIVLRHQLPNALLPLITIAGMQLGVMIGGIVVLELVFNWPGIGNTVVQAVNQRDYPVVQAGVLVLALVYIIINLIVDILYTLLDPRVRLS